MNVQSVFNIYRFKIIRNAFVHSRKFSVFGILNQKIIKCPYGNVQIPNVSLPEYLDGKIGKFSNLIATECVISGRKYTYDDLRIKSRNFGNSLRHILKLKKTDVIAIVMQNSPEYSIALLGAMKSGLIVTTVNPAYTPAEISRQLLDSSAKAIATLNESYDSVKAAVHLTKKDIPVIVIKEKSTDSLPDKTLDFMELANLELDMPEVEVSPEDIAVLPYSSGTTGLPKGVELTHRNLIATIAITSIPEINLKVESTVDYQDVVAHVLPMFHIFGLHVSLSAIYSGSKVVSIPKFTPDLYISALQNFKPTMLLVVPPLFLFLTNHPGVKKEFFDQVRVLLCGAAPLGAADEERFLKKIEKDIFLMQGYGLTETAGTVTVTDLNNVVHGSIGSPLPNTELKIVSIDDPAKVLGPNEPGELLIRGPQVMKQYYNNPEATKEVLVDGWLRSGDIGYYTKNDAIFITDRLKELIKVKGFQVAPAELEEIIRDFPDIEEAAVIGVPHEKYGEVPRAYLVPKKGATVDVNKLNEFVNNKVVEYKRLLGGIEVVQSIPRNASGKIMRRNLKLSYVNK